MCWVCSCRVGDQETYESPLLAYWVFCRYTVFFGVDPRPGPEHRQAIWLCREIAVGWPVRARTTTKSCLVYMALIGLANHNQTCATDLQVYMKMKHCCSSFLVPVCRAWQPYNATTAVQRRALQYGVPSTQAAPPVDRVVCAQQQSAAAA